MTGPSAAGRLVRFFRTHPIVALAVLTPGIPEYLSTSSPVLNLAVNPLWFFLQLAINVGQYTAGALLVREAVLRWHKGWASVFLLGGAYAIVEEGLGDNTLFNSRNGADGVLGSYGRFLGVNWVWSTGVIAFHVILSIGLPILLLGLALPSTRGRSLIGRRGVGVALTTLAGSTALEALIVRTSFGYGMGWPLFLGCWVAIALLVLAAYRVPTALWRPRPGPCTLTPRLATCVGFVLFPTAFFLEYVVSRSGVPPVAIILADLVVFFLLLEVVRRKLGTARHDRALVHLAFGFLLWQSVFGVLLTIGLPYTLPLVAVTVLFFVRLRRGYPADERPAVPA